MNARELASRILYKVVHAKIPLPEAMADAENHADKALIQALCYGVCRYWPRLTVILDTYLKKPLSASERDIEIIIKMGLYQLMEMRVREHAAVYETANVARFRKKSWAVPLINAILRRHLREHKQHRAKWEQQQDFTTMHSQWLLSAIQKNWPQASQSIIESNNQLPPMVLRVNQKKISRSGYLNKLKACGITGKPCEFSDMGIELESPVNISELPDFFSGYVSIQDQAAQLAANFLNLKPGLSVLDACAAPGGKLMHILEKNMSLKKVMAWDHEKNRIEKIKENLQRCHLEAEVIQQDVLNIEKAYQTSRFDRILLDAPCSATGVIRRNPDIKIIRTREDVNEAGELQLQMLEKLWQLLASGGQILYVTCSIMPEENEAVIKKFLNQTSDAKAVYLSLQAGHHLTHGLQILPGEHNMDGFYFCLLEKT